MRNPLTGRDAARPDSDDADAATIAPRRWRPIVLAAAWSVAAIAAAYMAGFVASLGARLFSVFRGAGAEANLAAFSGLAGGTASSATLLLVGLNYAASEFDDCDERFGFVGTRATKAAILASLCLALGIWVVTLAALRGSAAADMLQAMYSLDAWLAVSLLALVVIVAPICEETFYRRWLWNVLVPRWGAALAVAIAGAIWLALSLPAGVVAVLHLVPLAIAVSVARWVSGSVWGAVLVRALNSILAVLAPSILARIGLLP